MERKIVIEPLQKAFDVGIKKANRQAKNRSYPNASDCCGVRLTQRMHCTECNAHIEKPNDSKRKIFKVGKDDDRLVDAVALKEVRNNLSNQSDIKLHTFLPKLPKGAEDRFEALEYAIPAKKRSAHYKELVEIMKGRVAIGNGVFGSNEFQVVVTADDGVVRIRKLVDETQRYDFDEESVRREIADIQVSKEVVDLERQILDKKMVEEFDVKEFIDKRIEMEEKIIEEFLLTGKVPEVKQEIQQEQDGDELERLKALMG